MADQRRRAAVSATALATQPNSNLHRRLDALVRHEFRVDVLVPAADDPILGTPACEVSDCVHSSRYGGLCLAHLRRWNLDDRPDRRAWVAAADPAVLGHRALQRCQVTGCGYGQHQHRLCYRHARAWDISGRPTVEQWTPSLATATRVCALPGCSLWAELDGGWCRSHHARWRQRGRPPASDFIAYCTNYGEDHFDFRALPTQLRLEIQYAIQCRVDSNRARTTPRSIKALLDHLAADSTTVSLLDHSVQDWLARLSAAALTSSPRAFLGYAIDCLLDVRDGTGWDSEYPRDVWQLRRLGVAAGHGARLDFTPVQPRWLRELAKRWCRWRISCGIGLGQLRKDLIAIVRLSRLTPGLAASTGPAALDRSALETYLAQLAVAVPHAKTRSTDISSVTGLLRAVRQHRWARLPAEAELYPSDHPRRAEASTPRAIPEFVMNQLEGANNLARLTDPRIRLLVELLIRTGLRIGDATRLGLDCLTRDHQGAVYLHYRNHKMRRDAMVPIDDELTTLIEAQQIRARQQFPDTSVLLPRGHANPDGRFPIHTGTFDLRLKGWMADIAVTDEFGCPVKVTPHQFRHTYATRLNLRGIASDASFGSRGECCGSGDLGIRWRRRRQSGCPSTRPLSCVDARHHTARMHWVQR